MTPTLASATYSISQGSTPGAIANSPFGKLNDVLVDQGTAGSAAWLNALQTVTQPMSGINGQKVHTAADSHNDLNHLAIKGASINAALRKSESDLAGDASGQNPPDQAITESQAAQKAHHEQALLHARQLVAQTFYGPMLKQMRSSPFKSELFSGGRGGEAFGAMYDQELMQHMSRGTGQKLVDAIVHKLENRNSTQTVPQQVSSTASAAEVARSQAAEQSDQEQRKAINESKQTINPYSNVRIHVAPNLGN